MSKKPVPQVRHTPVKPSNAPSARSEASKAAQAEREDVVHHTDALHPAASVPDSAKSPIGGPSRDPLDQELEDQAQQRENLVVDGPKTQREVVDAILNALTGIKNNLPAAGEMNRQQIDMLDTTLGNLVRDYSSKRVSDKITRNA